MGGESEWEVLVSRFCFSVFVLFLLSHLVYCGLD